MPFYFRRSVNFGLFKLNFSNSGIGTSVGFKGFRVGMRPNGSTYMHAGRYGYYYREELTPARSSRRKELGLDQSGTTAETNINLNEYTSASKKELVEEINRSNSLIRLDLVALVVFSALFVWVMNSKFSYKIEASYCVAGFGALVVSIVFLFEKKRRLICLDYEFDPNFNKFDNINKAFDEMNKSHSAWVVESSESLEDWHSQKRNSGAGSLVNKKNILINKDCPNWIKSNIKFPCLNINGMKIFFMPDGLLIKQSGSYKALDYSEVRLSSNFTNFIVDGSPPSDAKIVSYTWRYPNKKGGPDRRFGNNKQIPVCLYGVIVMSSDKGLRIKLMLSNSDLALRFVEKFKRSSNGMSNDKLTNNCIKNIESIKLDKMMSRSPGETFKIATEKVASKLVENNLFKIYRTEIKEHFVDKVTDESKTNRPKRQLLSILENHLSQIGVDVSNTDIIESALVLVCEREFSVAVVNKD
ncbi:DUF4236 domain-containing protein [Desulfovibrio sp. TomC]|uniref:DUF4236 domain-containing protein n=1 Tax=Desulfovibrio sp. TomC TaxID=1562888 RepID=UPI000575B2D2|nr:DUF4236 domain-containing protein [Desulfovibrio sp. TomC]KHK00231.1 hypothetical protein NY78_4346 [Desulfovibrio sp. TomC]